MQKLDEKKLVASIDSRLLRMLSIDPDQGVNYLESKMAMEMNPVHVKALQLLKQSAVASS